jgi:hypothetical protein
MRVKIVENLIAALIGYFGDESVPKDDQSLLDLAKRIEGKEVNLIPTGSYHYEENDPEQWWIPSTAWETI